MIEMSEANTASKATKQIVKEDLSKNLEYQRKKDAVPVKGIFRNFEVPGGQLEFVYKKYKPEPVKTYKFLDGEIRTIPLGVAKHLNKNGWYPIHKYTQDENGKTSQLIGQKVRRFAFQSLEFVDVDEFEHGDKQIITVKNL